MDELILMVKDLKIKDSDLKRKEVINKIKEEKSITIKCLLARKYLPPQSTVMEKIIMKDLNIDKPKNKTSGDGYKNGIKYEIKFSGHAKYSNFNFVQLRPDHDVDFYIIVCYDLYFEEPFGKGFVFKIPSDVINNLIIKYGGYAHGTKEKLGTITKENIKGNNNEYALRCCPRGKKIELWNEIIKFETEYNPEYF